MRACLATSLGLLMGLPPAAVAAPWSAPAPLLASLGPEEDKPPEVLYEEGKKAYRLGKFDEAVQKWEKAYDLSERALLLYNISLAYKGRYGISGDIEDLRKARAVMKNFLIIAQADPDVDPDDAEARISELDGMIADAEANRPMPPPEKDEPKEQDEPKSMLPQGPDPGRTLRIAGAATMGGGGLLVVTGAVLGIFYGVKGQEFSDELRQLQSERDMFCTDPDSTECAQQDANIDTARNNGRQANLGLGLALGIGGGLGLVAL
ncbi:MAG: tetratricopeptide repeat protein, partial [Myxococcales bacterium]|nr:tetratricopeptide repeat protein [Myxococcales bacterium]